MSEGRAWLKSHTVLRDMMTAQRVPVRVLAERAGCGKSMIGLLRSGARTSCSACLALKIAAALQVPSEALFILGEEGGEAVAS